MFGNKTKLKKWPNYKKNDNYSQSGQIRKMSQPRGFCHLQTLR